MTPYYEQDGITIYHGDCREVLSGLRADTEVIAELRKHEKRLLRHIDTLTEGIQRRKERHGEERAALRAELATLRAENERLRKGVTA